MFAWRPLPDDDIACLEFHRFQQRKETLNAGHGHPGKQLRLQHPGHPVDIVFLSDIADLDLAGGNFLLHIVLWFFLVLHDQQFVQGVPDDLQYHRVGVGSGGELPGLQLGHGIPGPVGTGDDQVVLRFVGDEGNLALQQIIGILIPVSLLEDEFAFFYLDQTSLNDEFILSLSR